jgi:FtsH ternary system-associated peptide
MTRATPLAWLAFPDALGTGPPAFDSLVRGPGAIVVEALTSDLARRWQTIELGKRIIEQPDVLIALGDAQDDVLRGFMAACDKAKRRDLALFVIDAAADALARGLSPMPIQLDPTSTMSVRAQARVAAGALLRGVTAWAEWDRQHRGVRFIDDDYAAAQLLLSEFERIQTAGVERATAWLSELASLAPTPTSPGPDSAATVKTP